MFEHGSGSRQDMLGLSEGVRAIALALSASRPGHLVRQGWTPKGLEYLGVLRFHTYVISDERGMRSYTSKQSKFQALSWQKSSVILLVMKSSGGSCLVSKCSKVASGKSTCTPPFHLPERHHFDDSGNTGDIQSLWPGSTSLWIHCKA